jgi:hypothetical protein
MKQHFGASRFRKLQLGRYSLQVLVPSRLVTILTVGFRCYPLRTFQQRLKFRTNI